MTEDFTQRFGGIIRLYGTQAATKFSQSHVCVVGIGGVGAWVAEALARSGIGYITLIDMDELCITNINRQIHALTDTIGEPKVDVMAQRIAQINPACQVNAIEDFLTPDTFEAYLGQGFDFIVEAIDSAPTKSQILDWCKRRKQKVISIGGAGGQIDPTQIQVCDISKTIQDPLMANVRHKLRRDFGFSKSGKKFGIECVYSTEQLTYPAPDGSVCQQKPEAGATRMDCQGGFGASTCVTASFAFIAVAHVLKKLKAAV